MTSELLSSMLESVIFKWEKGAEKYTMRDDSVW